MPISAACPWSRSTAALHPALVIINDPYCQYTDSAIAPDRRSRRFVICFDSKLLNAGSRPKFMLEQVYRRSNDPEAARSPCDISKSRDWCRCDIHTCPIQNVLCHAFDIVDTKIIFVLSRTCGSLILDSGLPGMMMLTLLRRTSRPDLISVKIKSQNALVCLSGLEAARKTNAVVCRI